MQAKEGLLSSSSFSGYLLSTCSTRLKIEIIFVLKEAYSPVDIKYAVTRGHVNGVTMGQKWTDTVGAQIEALGKQAVGT